MPGSLVPQSPPGFCVSYQSSELTLFRRTFYWGTLLLDVKVPETATWSLDDSGVVGGGLVRHTSSLLQH